MERSILKVISERYCIGIKIDGIWQSAKCYSQLIKIYNKGELIFNDFIQMILEESMVTLVSEIKDVLFS